MTSVPTNRLLYRPWFIVTLTIALFVATLTILQQFASFERERSQQRMRALVLSQAGTVRTRLEGAISSTLYLTRGLTAYVATHPQVDEGTFADLAAEIMSESPIVRNIGLAPGNILRFVYPHRGNEEAIGLRYLELPKQRDAVLHAIETHHTVVAGPVDLVQGGKGLINRTPIYANDPGSPEGHRYWGLASVVINQSTLFEQAGLVEERDGVRYALRGKDGLGAAGAPFFGDPTLFVQDAVILPIALPEGSWQLAALPVGGWAGRQEPPYNYYLGATAVAALLALLLYILLRERQEIQHLALHDTLTDLPNRLHFTLRLEHTLQRAARSGNHFALLYLDLDDFKPINDRYGHKAGDLVLAETARRLRATLRRADTVARIGGDEFMVILEGMQNADEVCAVARKLIDALGAPFDLGVMQAQVGVSVGIAVYPPSGRDTDQLIRAADQAMYRAKALGKNRCICDDAVPLNEAPAA